MWKKVMGWRSGANLAWCLCAWLLLSANVHGATLSLCGSDTDLAGGMARTELYVPGGALMTLSMGEAPQSDCRNVELPVAAEAIRWFALSDIVPDAPPGRLALQGIFDGRDIVVSEVIHAGQPAPPPTLMPLGENLLPYLQSRAFGVEERSMIAEDGSIVCAAGTQAAGAMLRAKLPWETMAGMQLELVLRGSGEFGFGVADRERETREAPLELGAATLDATATTVRYVLPANPQPWSSLTILCPGDAATLQLDSLRLLPPTADAAPRPRATWLWSPALWREMPERIWQIARAENLQRVYVTVPVVENGTIEHADMLATFLAEARAHDLEVWAVLGDPHDVLRENRALLLRRVEAYRTFNKEHAETERLAGVQLDVEPYLLPGFALDHAYWRDSYLQMVNEVYAQLAQELALDLVMPSWWGSHPAWGAQLLDGLVKPGLSVTVMNYRTTPAELRAGALPFLAWGEEKRVRVNMALESGNSRINSGSDSGRSETRLGFESAEAGELWLFKLDGLGLLVLLDGEHEGLPGHAYRRTDATVIDTSTITFAGAPERLANVMATMVKEWGEWAAFAGLALHGVEENWMRRFDDEVR